MRADRRPTARRGLTVVEVLAALVILTVGLLGLAGTAALSFRAAGRSAQQRRAVGILSARLAMLAAGGCARATDGTAESALGGVRLRWTVGVPARGAALIDATAEWPDRGGIRSVTLRSAILC